MNDFADQKSEDTRPAVSLRPEQPGDESFIFSVYASTREEELALTGWDVATCTAFLNMQFKAMRGAYGSMFPQGEFLIVELEGKSMGRMVINRAKNEIRVVDLALLPAHRNRGIGTWLMHRVCAEAKQAEKPVRLCVLKHNRALHWYERLGFTKIKAVGIYEELEWRAAPAPI